MKNDSKILDDIRTYMEEASSLHAQAYIAANKAKDLIESMYVDNVLPDGEITDKASRARAIFFRITSVACNDNLEILPREIEAVSNDLCRYFGTMKDGKWFF